MPDDEILSVGDLTGQIKALVEGNLPSVAVCGEISGLTRAGSGHLYFTLKDADAQIRGVMWRSTAARLRFDPADGLEVIAGGQVEVYAPRGTYQLICRSLRPLGVGGLEEAFRKMRDRLAAEGLFDAERKRPLPPLPRHIALVTSPAGAAVRDMLRIFGRRWPATRLTVVPVRVQGEGAAAEIADALDAVSAWSTEDRPDLAVVGRGGGSLEDLWAFNEEPVARAIARCGLPVVSAVGHETDVTIADLVADARAATPSEAAELTVPDRVEVAAGIAGLRDRLVRGASTRAARARETAGRLFHRAAFRNPDRVVRERTQRADEAAKNLTKAATLSLARRDRLAAVAAELNGRSPLATLSRGYSLTSTADGRLVRSGSDVSVGDDLTTRLADGVVLSRVTDIDPS
ncbi:MAG: exodeoxyribonuclease VII large subunit [Planctomycetota bacterium]